MKKLIACKNLLNSIITSNNLLQQAKQEYYSGYGKIIKEAFNFILLKFQQKKH